MRLCIDMVKTFIQLLIHLLAVSKAPPPLIRMPRLAPTVVPTSIAVGVANPKAHGQLITTTDMEHNNANSTGLPYSSAYLVI